MQARIPRLSALDKKTVLVLGTGRSGTTWLAGLLAAPFRYRLLFEPFHPEQVDGAAAVADHYYGPQAVPDEVRRFCRSALNDEIDSDWIAQGSNRRWRMHRWRFWPRARVCKSIRTNLLIPAYREMFGPDLPIIAVVRRPEEVVESFLRVGFPWATDIDVLLEQTEPIQRWQLPVDQLRALAGTPVGALSIRWMIENLALLRGPSADGVHLVRYETLHKSPAETIRAVCSLTGLQPADDLESRVPRHSHTTHPRSPLHSAGDAAARLLDAEGNRTVRRVLELGGLESEMRSGG